MAKFSIISCLYLFVRLVVAYPDVSLGYRYNQGYSSSGIGTLQTPYATGNSYVPPAVDSSYFSSSPPFGFSATDYSSSGVPLGGSIGVDGFGGNVGIVGHGGGFRGASGGFSSSGGYGGSLAPIISKHFYSYSAPLDHDEQQIVRHINVGRPRQNHRVIFINAPSSSSQRAKIIANVAPIEDKTAIYVLSKKTNQLDLSAEVVTPAPTHHKPEIFFLKYKTDAEAEHAQHNIQAQYDALGGSSSISNSVTAPISSVIGHAGGPKVIDSSDSSSIVNGAGSGGGSGGVSIAHTLDNSQQTYLPAQFKKKRSPKQ